MIALHQASVGPVFNESWVSTLKSKNMHLEEPYRTLVAQGLISLHVIINCYLHSRNVFALYAQEQLYLEIEKFEFDCDQGIDPDERRLDLLGAANVLVRIESQIDFSRPALENASEMCEQRRIFYSLLDEAVRDNALFLTAAIACGLGVSAFDWAKQNLQLLRVDLPVDGTKSYVLALAPKSDETHEFFLVQAGYTSFRMGNADAFVRWGLLSATDAITAKFRQCLFPLELRFGKDWDDGSWFKPGPVKIWAAVP